MAVNLASRATMTSIGLRYVRAFHREREESWPGTELDDVEYAMTVEEWLRSPTEA